VGQQVHLVVDGEDFYIDLLLYGQDEFLPLRGGRPVASSG
jgi:hypothetical protein